MFKIIQTGTVAPNNLPDVSLLRYDPPVKPQPGQILIVQKTLVLMQYDIRYAHKYYLINTDEETPVNCDIISMLEDVNSKQTAMDKIRKEIGAILDAANPAP